MLSSLSPSNDSRMAQSAAGRTESVPSFKSVARPQWQRMPAVLRLQEGKDYSTETTDVARRWAAAYAELERCSRDLNFELDLRRVAWFVSRRQFWERRLEELSAMDEVADRR